MRESAGDPDGVAPSPSPGSAAPAPARVAETTPNASAGTANPPSRGPADAPGTVTGSEGLAVDPIETVARAGPDGSAPGTDATASPPGADPDPALAPALPSEDRTPVFADEFDGSGDLAVGRPDSLWRFESLEDALHRAGNSGMDEVGDTDVPSWRSPAGKRWSAWYDDYHDDNAYRSDGLLVLQGLDSGRADPTRRDRYFDEGVSVDYGSSRLYTVWLDTWARTWSNELNRHVTDPDSPNRTFRYGRFEMRVNFSEMITPGFRLSWWLMPASRDAEGQHLVASDAYDADGDNGVEIDIFEYEYVDGQNPHRLQLALHGGAAGKDAETFDASSIGVDLRSGFHVIALDWRPDALVWTIDGIEVKRVTDRALIPDTYAYMIVSREMNSGVKREGVDGFVDGDALEVMPYRPRDPGLYGWNVWAYRDRLARDRALIDYVRVWQR